jgi:threonine dehydratase
LRDKRPLHLFDTAFIALVEGPLLDVLAFPQVHFLRDVGNTVNFTGVARMTGREQHVITPERIRAAEVLIRPHIRRAPVVALDGGDIGIPQASFHLKLEMLQHAGSFKARGAFANLLMRPIPAAGVAAASGGNHGAAVAYAAMKLAIPARIFVPSISSPAKIARIRDYGAELVIGGERYADALAASEA